MRVLRGHTCKDVTDRRRLARFEAKEQGPELKPRERYFSELVNPAPDDQLAARQITGCTQNHYCRTVFTHTLLPVCGRPETCGPGLPVKFTNSSFR